ncbi:MAG: hypothetical protein ABR860_14020 [Terracidiphilus sp.]|jgi:hypothetical protein
MRRLVLGSLLSFACFACAQQPQQQQIPGDVYESGSGAGTPAQAVQKLYDLAAEMIADPSSGYDAQTGQWPEADAAWQQWDNSMGSNGNTLTQQQRPVLTACATHLNAAIGDAERSYLIQKSQPNNAPAQADAQKLLGTARTEFEKCNLADALNGSNGTPASSPGSPGNPLKAGVSAGPDDTPTANTPPSDSGGTPVASSGGAPTDPGLTPSPETPGALPLPANVRQQLLDTAGQLDKVLDDAQSYSLAATNRFFKCLGEALSADLKFLAQPGYVPAAQIAQSLHAGVTNYFTSNAASNNLQAYQAAQQSLNTLKSDPACFAANIAPAIATVAVTHLAGALAEANATQAAANDAIKVATEETERETAWNAGPGKYGANPANPKNPACAPNMCFPSAIAEEVSQEFGQGFAAVPYEGNVTTKIIEGVETQVFNITGKETVRTMLQDLFSSKKLQGPALSSERMKNQMTGTPSPMDSGSEIQQELKAAGPGARGIVFVDYNPTTADPEPAGHTFNVRNVNGVPMARDFSNAGIDASSFFQGVKQIWFYRTQ